MKLVSCRLNYSLKYKSIGITHYSRLSVAPHFAPQCGVTYNSVYLFWTFKSCIHLYNTFDQNQPIFLLYKPHHYPFPSSLPPVLSGARHTSFCCFGQGTGAAIFAAAITTLLTRAQSLCISSSSCSTNDEGHKKKTEKEIERCPLISLILPYQGTTQEGVPWLTQKVSRTALIMESRGLFGKRDCTTHEKTEVGGWDLPHDGPSGNSSLSDKVADGRRISLSMLETVLGSVLLFWAQSGCVELSLTKACLPL